LEQKVCLDTDVAISILNGEERAEKLVEVIESTDVFISVVTLFELLLRETNLEKIELFRQRVKIIDFNEQASRKASLIFKDLRKKGRLIDFRDIFIASICIVNNSKLATFNKKHFENINELELVHI